MNSSLDCWVFDLELANVLFDFLCRQSKNTPPTHPPTPQMLLKRYHRRSEAAAASPPPGFVASKLVPRLVSQEHLLQPPVKGRELVPISKRGMNEHMNSLRVFDSDERNVFSWREP